MALLDPTLDREKAKFREIGSGGSTVVGIAVEPNGVENIFFGGATAGSGTSDAIDFSKYKLGTIHITAGSIEVPGGTVTIQGSLDGTNYKELESFGYTALTRLKSLTGLSGTVTHEFSGTAKIQNRKYAQLRALLTQIESNTTFKVVLYSGN